MIHCALCRFEYEPVPSCPASCPLNGACHFVCCPRCGYQNIDVSQSSSVKIVCGTANVILNAVCDAWHRRNLSLCFENSRKSGEK